MVFILYSVSTDLEQLEILKRNNNNRNRPKIMKKERQDNKDLNCKGKLKMFLNLAQLHSKEMTTLDTGLKL